MSQGVSVSKVYAEFNLYTALAHTCSVASVMSDSLRQPSYSVRGDSPGKNTEVGCHALPQGIFPTQGSNLRLLYRRRILDHFEPPGKPCGEAETRQKQLWTGTEPGPSELQADSSPTEAVAKPLWSVLL